MSRDSDKQAGGRDSYLNRFAANRELLTAVTRRHRRAALPPPVG